MTGLIKNTKCSFGLIAPFAILLLGLLIACTQKAGTDEETSDSGVSVPALKTLAYVERDENVLELIQSHENQKFQLKFNGTVAFEPTVCEKRDLLPELPYRESMSIEEVIVSDGKNRANFQVTSERQVGSRLSYAEFFNAAQNKTYTFSAFDTVMFNESAWFSELKCSRLPAKEISLSDKIADGLKLPREGSNFTGASVGFVEGAQFVSFESDEAKTFFCWEDGLIEKYFDDYQEEGIAFTQFRLKPELRDKTLHVTWEIRESKDAETGQPYEEECLVSIEAN